MASRTWSVQGSASEPYKLALAPNGRLSCSCPISIHPRGDRTRFCKHLQRIAAQEGFRVEERGIEAYVVDEGAPIEVPPPAVERPASEGFIAPMLASKMPDGWDADRYDAALYVMEEKFDGIRLVSRVDSRVRSWSRAENLQADIDPEVREALALLPPGVYDGELVAREAGADAKSFRVKARARGKVQVLVLFDMLEALGKPTAKFTQDERRAMLAQAAEALSGHTVTKAGLTYRPVVLSEQFSPSMAKVRAVWARGGEGAIIKRRGAPYRPGVRTVDWIKVKRNEHTTITITGFDEGESGPYSTTVGLDANGIEIRVKTLDNAALRDIAKSPRSYIGRRLVVEFQERIAGSGKVRHPFWDHLAADGE